MEAISVEDLIAKRDSANRENSRTIYYKRVKDIEKNRKIFVWIPEKFVRQLEIIQVYNEQLTGRNEPIQDIVATVFAEYVMRHDIPIKEMYAKLQSERKEPQ